MSMDVSRIDIAELAELLEDRKNNNQKFALFLGSRAGALSRSLAFAEEMAAYSTRAYPSVDIKGRAYFTECYSLLKDKKKQSNENDLETFLRQKIEDVNQSPADACMADLVKQSIFKVIVYASPDDLLYEAFTALGLRKNDDFVEFDIDRHIMMDNFDDIVSYEKVNACKVIKLYNDAAAFVNGLNKSQKRQDASLYMKKLLERMWIKEVLMVGMDLVWDEVFLSALPSRVKTVWFINEDEQALETFRSTYERIEQFRCIIGKQGEYEKIFKALYLQINPGTLPTHYELASQLQNQLTVVNHNMTSIDHRLETLQKNVDYLQRQITKVAWHVEEVAKYCKDEKE